MSTNKDRYLIANIFGAWPAAETMPDKAATIALNRKSLLKQNYLIKHSHFRYILSPIGLPFHVGDNQRKPNPTMLPIIVLLICWD